MRFQIVSLFYILLSMVAVLFVATVIRKLPAKSRTTEEEEDRRPIRDSATLRDETFTYHLNYSQFLLEFPHLQLYQCSLLLTPPVEPRTGKVLPLLILAIKSHPQSLGRRWALRQTWAKRTVLAGFMVMPIFLLGQSHDIRHMEIVKVESKEYGDILQWDFDEGHHNLSLKERCFLEWLHHHTPHVDFIFKGDDDMFVNPAAMIEFIKEHGFSPHTLYGAVQRHSVVLRYSKYQVSTSLFPYSKYPYFLSGGGFLFPGPSVQPLYQASLKIPVFPLDDVYFGFLVLSANLTLSHNSRFYVFGLDFEACQFKQAFVVHRISPEGLIDVWSAVQREECSGALSGVTTPRIL